MAQKQGGKGKSSSPSDLGYWKRVSPERQRAKRIERHARRLLAQGKFSTTPNALKAAINFCEPTGKLVYPRKPQIFPPQRVVFNSNAHDLRSPIFPIDQIIASGVILESSSRESDALACIAMLGTHVAYQHIRQLPSGRRILISSRAGN